jgi:hypothetical protein
MSSIDFHRTISFVMGPILIFMAITGGYWTVRYRAFGDEKSSVKWLLKWHQGDVFDIDPSGKVLKGPFCTAVMLGTIFIAVSGILNINTRSLKKNRNEYRSYHQFAAILSGIPLLFSAITGGFWAISR